MYTRYFSPGQKILLRFARTDQLPHRIEAVSTRMISYDNGCFQLALLQPWQSGESLFGQQNNLELVSERHGMGLKSTATFNGLTDGKLIHLHANNDLTLFRPRPKPRIDTHIGLRHFSTKTGFSYFYKKWLQAVDKFNNPSTALNEPILPLGPVNLSGTGIRMALNAPVTKHDLVLMILELHPDETPICTLGEVIWSSPKTSQNLFAGLRFLNILQKDQERIERLIQSATISHNKTTLSRSTG